jgi:hypothetical protein
LIGYPPPRSEELSLGDNGVEHDWKSKAAQNEAAMYFIGVFIFILQLKVNKKRSRPS